MEKLQREKREHYRYITAVLDYREAIWLLIRSTKHGADGLGQNSNDEAGVILHPEAVPPPQHGLGHSTLFSLSFLPSCSLFSLLYINVQVLTNSIPCLLVVILDERELVNLVTDIYTGSSRDRMFV